MKIRTAQDIQDEIFKKMSADRRVELGAQFWKLAKELVEDKINYARWRPETTTGKNRKNA